MGIFYTRDRSLEDVLTQLEAEYLLSYIETCSGNIQDILREWGLKGYITSEVRKKRLKKQIETYEIMIIEKNKYIQKLEEAIFGKDIIAKVYGKEKVKCHNTCT